MLNKTKKLLQNIIFYTYTSLINEIMNLFIWQPLVSIILYMTKYIVSIFLLTHIGTVHYVVSASQVLGIISIFILLSSNNNLSIFKIIYLFKLQFIFTYYQTAYCSIYMLCSLCESNIGLFVILLNFGCIYINDTGQS